MVAVSIRRLCLASITIACFSPVCNSSPPARPNILLLLTDDQDVLLGGLDRMPKLRRELTTQGTTFSNSFVHTPICCPSRTSILSGRYLHNGGALNNSVSGNCDGERWRDDAERLTFAVRAKEAGYVTSYAGKYLNDYGTRGSPGCDNPETDPGCRRVPPGWDKWFGLVGNSCYYNYGVIRSDDGGKTSRRIEHGDTYESDYLPDLVANRTLEVIDELLSKGSTEEEEEEGRQPFLAVLAWPTPHGPFTPAPWAEGLYDGARAHRTPNWNASAEHMRTKHWLMRRLAPIDGDTEGWIDHTYERRLEALRSVDNHIGDIVDLLRRRRALDDTVIIYMSDNGFQLGQHRLQGDKRQLYEHDIRVPFVVTGPGVPRNVTTDRIVLNIDIAPTIYELATGSSALPSDMDGMSFAPYLNGHEARQPHRVDFLVSYHGEGDPRCGMAECPPPPPSQYHGGWEPDSFNNTYHCVRTIRGTHDGDVKGRSGVDSGDSFENVIYCHFKDSEEFVEYYNLHADAWQLVNQYDKLSRDDRDQFEARLAQLRACRGETCRLLPTEQLSFSRTSY